MHQIELVFVLLAVSGALQILARRLTVPYPSLLVIGGLALAFIPGLPRIDRDPEVLFFVFIPPLLYWTAVTTSLHELRDLFGPVARLSTGLVVLTMVAVAVVIHALSPEFSWGSALLLGAIVAPPDPVAAAAVIRPLGISREVTTVLEGEGLFNDATALVAYVPANAVGASGVLAVVALGLYLGRRRSEIISPATRIQGEAMWTVLTFMLESVDFRVIHSTEPKRPSHAQPRQWPRSGGWIS